MKNDLHAVLSDRDLATVLAALRFWQKHLDQNQQPAIREHFAEGIAPLTVVEIDALCERLNVAAAPH